MAALLVGFGSAWLAFRGSNADDAPANARFEKSSAVQVAVKDILDDPTAFGTDDEVVDLLATYAAPNAQMEDDVFGSVGMRTAWYNTLYSGAMDAEIVVFHQWVAEDGSQTSSLWDWRGTNAAGNPFSLIGVAVDAHDDEGLISHELVIYPYPDEFVRDAVFGAGTEP